MKKIASFLPLLIFAATLLAALIFAILGKVALCAPVLVVGTLLALALRGVFYAVLTLKKTGLDAAAELEKNPPAAKVPDAAGEEKNV